MNHTIISIDVFKKVKKKLITFSPCIPKTIYFWIKINWISSLYSDLRNLSQHCIQTFQRLRSYYTAIQKRSKQVFEYTIHKCQEFDDLQKMLYSKSPYNKNFNWLKLPSKIAFHLFAEPTNLSSLKIHVRKRPVSCKFRTLLEYRLLRFCAPSHRCNNATKLDIYLININYDPNIDFVLPRFNLCQQITII